MKIFKIFMMDPEHIQVLAATAYNQTMALDIAKQLSRYDGLSYTVLRLLPNTDKTEVWVYKNGELTEHYES